MDNVSEACNCWTRDQKKRRFDYEHQKRTHSITLFSGCYNTRTSQHTCPQLYPEVFLCSWRHHAGTHPASGFDGKVSQNIFPSSFFRCRTTLVIRWCHQIRLFLECEKYKYFWMFISRVCKQSDSSDSSMYWDSLGLSIIMIYYLLLL